jgi:hypothetical protein
MSQSPYSIGAPAEGAAAKDWLSPRALRLLAAGLTLALVLICALQLSSSAQAAQAAGRLETLAGLSAKVSALAYGLETERDNTMRFIARTNAQNGVRAKTLSPAAQSELQEVRQQYADTNTWAARVEARLAAIGSGYPDGVAQAARSVSAEVRFLGSVRRAALSIHASALDVLARYTAAINVLLTFENEIGRTTNDSQLMATVSAMSQMSRIQDELSIQRGLIGYALTAGAFAPNMRTALQASIADQYSDSDQFQNFASTQQIDFYQKALASRSYAERVSASERTVSHYAQSHASLTGLGLAPDEWFGNSTELITKVRSVEVQLNGEVQHRAQSLHRSALTTSAIFSALIVLLIAVIAVVIWPLIASRLRRQRV